MTLLICERLGMSPVPYLMAEAMASNIGGTATLIGDPPNIIIASRADLSFNDFLVNMAPIVVVLLGVFLMLARFLFRRSFTYDADRAAAVMALEERGAIRDHRLLLRSLVVLGLVLAGFVLHAVLHVDPVSWRCSAPAAGAGVGADLDQYLADVEWETLVFFAGLFIMVGSLVNVGVIGQLGEGRRSGGRQLLRRRHRPALRLGGPVRHRGQHPVRRHHVAPGR